MKKIILITLFFSTQVLGRAINSPPISIPQEGWIKLKCSGAVTKKYEWPVGYEEIMSFFVKINMYDEYPSMLELSERNPDKFKNITRYCTERRWGKMRQNWTGTQGQWLDWDSDWSYSNLEVSEVVINSLQCRAVGSPCEQSAQCCNSNQNHCNLVTNSCESNIISHDSGEIRDL